MAYEPNRDADFKLSDGRRIAYCEWGAPEGRPILLCHGSPGSRLFGPDSRTTAEADVRLITVDRPGYGRSDPKPDRQILDWPADVEELTSALGVAQFDVAGSSSGGPYALACAYRLPGRVQRVALVSCVAPIDEPPSQQHDTVDPTTGAHQDLVRAAEEIAESAAWLVENPERFFELPRPESDAHLMTDPAIRTMLLKTLRETARQGLGPYGWDCALELQPWGFALGDISTDVWIFHGEQDRLVPPSAARALAGALPSSHLRLFPDAGHGLLLGAWRSILEDFQSRPSF